MTGPRGATGAALLYGAGAAVLFGVRSWRHRRVTGRSGYVGFTRGRSRAARMAGGCFAAAVTIGLASPILARAGVLPSLIRPGGRAERAATIGGLVFTAIGFWAAVRSQEAMGRSWRIGVDENEQTDLVTDGVFAVVRNPIFTAMVAAQAGTALMAPTWLSASGVALLVAAVQLQVREVEEPYLRRVHGPGYAEYAARTGRFLPGLGCLAGPTRLSDTRLPDRRERHRPGPGTG